MALTPEQCAVGRVYRFHGRDYDYGVYVGNGAFRGIRTEWGERVFVDGTVTDIDDTGIDVPEGIVLSETVGPHAARNEALFAFLERLRVWAECSGCGGWASDGRRMRCAACGGRGKVPA